MSKVGSMIAQVIIEQDKWWQLLLASLLGGLIASGPVWLSIRSENKRFNEGESAVARHKVAERLRTAVAPALHISSAMSYCASDELKQTNESPQVKSKRLADYYNDVNKKWGDSVGVFSAEPRLEEVSDSFRSVSGLWELFRVGIATNNWSASGFASATECAEAIRLSHVQFVSEVRGLLSELDGPAHLS
jgi:hypothetical protein